MSVGITKDKHTHLEKRIKVQVVGAVLDDWSIFVTLDILSAATWIYKQALAGGAP